MSLPRPACVYRLLATILFIVFLAGCKTEARLAVGAKNSTEQLILAEIIAQHLEHHLNAKVERHFGLGGAAGAYQALQAGEITLYPEYTGAVITEILKEMPASDPAQVLQRARGEMDRLAHVALLDPLGFENPIVIVIRASDPRAAQLSTVDQAAQMKDGWKIAASYDTQQRSDGISLLSPYKLPLAAAIRGMEASLLFPALRRGDVTMIAARSTDGQLASSEWKILADNRGVFTSEQACILARQDALMKNPGLQPALAQLSGKFTTEEMRKLAAKIDVDHAQPASLAAEFLAGAGLR